MIEILSLSIYMMANILVKGLTRYGLQFCVFLLLNLVWHFSFNVLLGTFFFSFIILSFRYIYFTNYQYKDFILLSFFALISGFFILTSYDFITLFLALEMLSLNSYILVSFARDRKLNSQNGLKYLILSIVPIMFFLLGISGLYSNFGSFTFETIEMLSFLRQETILENTDVILNLNLEESRQTLLYSINESSKRPRTDSEWDRYFDSLPFWEKITWDEFRKTYKAGMECAGVTAVCFIFFLGILFGIDALKNKETSNDQENEPIIKKQGDLSDKKVSSFKSVDEETILDFSQWPDFFYEDFINFEKWVESLYTQNAIVVLGILIFFLLINFLFKMTVAPFHIWAQSIYNHAPLMSATFLSIFFKIIILSFLITFFSYSFSIFSQIWQWLLIILSILTVFVSIGGAIGERVIKRFYVYSSMTHVAFMFLGLCCGTIEGFSGALSYLFVYILSSILLWSFLYDFSKDAVYFSNLKTIFLHLPFQSINFTVLLFAMAGIPPLSGFFVKFEILSNLINTSFFWVAFVFLILSVFTFFYYIRLIKIIYFQNEFNYANYFYTSNDGKFLVWSHIMVFLIFYALNSIIFPLESINLVN